MKKFVTLLATLALVFVTAASFAQDNLEFFINTPAPGGLIEVGPPAADFGGNLAPGESITGDLAMVEAQNAANDTIAQMGCDSLLNGMDVMGKIALIRRGECFFSDKVWYAQQQGAIAAVICNSNPGEGVITMGSGGDFAGLAEIPSGFISYEDCEILIQELGAGGTGNITMRVPAFFGNISSYSYHTPQSQIIPIDIMEVTVVNADANDASDVVVTADITDPMGGVTTSTREIETLLAGADSTVVFDIYTPVDLGQYTVVYSNNINNDIITDGFVITEDVFAVDNGDPSNFAGPSDAQFATADAYRYHVGGLVLTGDNPGKAISCSFGIANGADFFLGDPAYDFIDVVLYNADADGDNVLDWAASGASFSDLQAIALGQYTVTGTETADDPLIMVDLFSLSGGDIELDPNGAYYISIQYNGQADVATIAPAFMSSGDVGYVPFPTTPLVLDQLYTGWAGEIVAVRLHLDLTSNVNEELLTEDKIDVSPNPASDFVNVVLDLEETSDEVVIDVMNYEGKIVETLNFDNIKSQTLSIDVTKYTTGYYFFSVKTAEGWKNTPVYIAH